MDLQDVIMRLNQYWAEQGCLLWQPYNVQVGAGTGNPATALRVLGPEPWKVAYVEPSVRPDDGRYGENPNRWQEYYQYQVILKPDPGNPQELYLDSLRALGIDTAEHDVRFVEDNWESPALGAWGLGWEVWLDGQEISQYTYFQQAGGQELNPVSVELTYGLERIVMVLQGVPTFPEIAWRGSVTYGDLRLRGEIEHCTYNFQVADVDRLRQMHDLCEAEAKQALAHGLVLPAHDYVLKCSHLFNVLDARGAIGVTERARYFVRMRDLSREVAALYVKQREEMGYPLTGKVALAAPSVEAPLPAATMPTGAGPWDLLLEIGSEELPVSDLDALQAQLRDKLTAALEAARLPFQSLAISGTPRRTVAQVRGLGRQVDQERVVKGPPARAAFDADGQPTKAALGFARSQGLEVSALERRTLDDKEYVVAVLLDVGREPSTVLAELLPTLIAGLSFPKSMRWNASGVAFSRPLRWFVSLLDDQVIPFEYAGLRSGRISRGNRSYGSPEISVASGADYQRVMDEAGIVLDVQARERSISAQVSALAEEIGGEVSDDPDLLREVANLVEFPLAIRGGFRQEYLRLPEPVLLAVMRKHQRYFPVLRDGKMLPAFITVANGANLKANVVRHGNEEVLRARYADAAFFYDADSRQPLDTFTPKLASLTFQERLGSVLDKVHRLERLVPVLGAQLALSAADLATARRVASLCKSDLATQLVIEITSLQGVMGRVYAEHSGESADVAQAIEEHYWPRSAGDKLPASPAAMAVGLADRLDSLVGLFAVGIRPTGAADPWGLRRAALGLVQLLVGKELDLDLEAALVQAAEILPVAVGTETLAEVLDYVVKRYRGYLLDSVQTSTLARLPYDQVDAVLAERGTNPYAAWRTLAAFGPWVQRADWEETLASYARCVRITRDLKERLPLDRATLGEPAAEALYDAYQKAAATLGPHSPLGALMEALVDLKPTIARFFTEVLVMADDPVARASRLALLQAISALPKGIVDLSLMEGF